MKRTETRTKVDKPIIKPQDRRQFVRIPARFAVLMKLDSEKFPDYTMEAEVINLSEGGVLLSLPDKRTSELDDPENNTTFYYGDLEFESLMTWLQFFLPSNDQPIRVLGKPSWVNRPDSKNKQCLMAMQFTHISPEDRIKLSYFIKNSASTES